MKQIYMTGLDYKKAGIEQREQLAMTKEQAKRACVLLQQQLGAEGCMLISTCNRTELWVSGSFAHAPQLSQALCQVKGLPQDFCSSGFCQRYGQEAAAYLFHLASGMESQIYGEDQIISQVRAAADLARQANTADAVLETLFRMAVTSAKEVKTRVRLAPAAASAAAGAVRFLKEKLGSLQGVSCLIIGNGEIGRLAAEELLCQGARVFMTLRSHHGGGVTVPNGCEPVPYDDRLLVLPAMNVVISATSSPHYTLRAPELPVLEQPILFCDLAVPRDIDPEIANLSYAKLFHTDELCGGAVQQATAEERQKAEKILSQGVQEFLHWLQFYPLVPQAKQTGQLAAQDFMGRIRKKVDSLPISETEKAELADQLVQAAQKTAERLAFGLREQLSPALWEPCIGALQKSAQQGTHHE